MPLLDSMKATLRADLDVTEMNKFLKTYVQQVVKNGIETAMAETIQKLVNNYTIEMDSRISEKLKGNDCLKVYWYVSMNVVFTKPFSAMDDICIIYSWYLGERF